MAHVFGILNLANNPHLAVCVKCGYEWEPRIKTSIKKCPACQYLLMRHREPWPPGFVPVEFSIYDPEHKDWPQVDDPDPKPDYDWLMAQRRLEMAAEERMKASAK